MSLLRKKEVEKKIGEISLLIGKEPDNPDHLRKRSVYWEQLGNLGQAVNDLKKILEISPMDQEAARRIQYLETILKFNNIDIFSDTNTSHDPWME